MRWFGWIAAGLVAGTIGAASADMPETFEIPDIKSQDQDGVILPQGLSLEGLSEFDASLSATARPQAYRQQIALAAQLGTILQFKTELAKFAAQYLITEYKINEDERLHGWIVHLDGETWTVYFIGEINEEMTLLYVVAYEDGVFNKDNVRIFADGAPVPEQVASMWRARTFATTNMQRGCSPTYNTAVIPLYETEAADSINNFLVYLLMPHNQSLLMIDGHYRMLINADATAIRAYKSYGQGCIGIKYEAKEGEEIELMVLPYEGEHPEDIHVYQSFKHNLPIFVMTMRNRYIWQVAGNRIGFFMDLSDNNTRPTVSNVLPMLNGTAEPIARTLPSTDTQKITHGFWRETQGETNRP